MGEPRAARNQTTTLPSFVNMSGRAQKPSRTPILVDGNLATLTSDSMPHSEAERPKAPTGTPPEMSAPVTFPGEQGEVAARGRGREGLRCQLESLEEILNTADARKRGKGRLLRLINKPRCESPGIKAAVAEYVQRTIEELGGVKNLSAGKKAMIFAQKTCLFVILSCEDEIVESKSLLAENNRPHDLLKVLQSFLATFRQGEIALGLGMRARMPRSDNQTMSRIMQEYANRTSKPVLVPEKPGQVGVKSYARGGRGSSTGQGRRRWLGVISILERQ
jgi:hypothetical protein